MLQTLSEVWPVIATIAAIVVPITTLFYKSMGTFRKEMREDMGKLREEVKQDINGLRNEVKQDISGLRSEMSAMSRLMMLCLIDPAAAKKQAIADFAKEPADLPKPKE